MCVYPSSSNIPGWHAKDNEDALDEDTLLEEEGLPPSQKRKSGDQKRKSGEPGGGKKMRKELSPLLATPPFPQRTTPQQFSRRRISLFQQGTRDSKTI